MDVQSTCLPIAGGSLTSWPSIQVMVVPISVASLEYAREVRTDLRSRRLHADVDATDKKMQKKIREAQLEQYNYILVSAQRHAYYNLCLLHCR